MAIAIGPGLTVGGGISNDTRLGEVAEGVEAPKFDNFIVRGISGGLESCVFIGALLDVFRVVSSPSPPSSCCVDKGRKFGFGGAPIF